MRTNLLFRSFPKKEKGFWYSFLFFRFQKYKYFSGKGFIGEYSYFWFL